MTAWCAQYMTALNLVCKRKISRRLRNNLHITILSLFGGEIIFEVPVFQPMWSWSLNVTDGQTGGQYTVESPRGKNRETKYCRYYRYRRHFKQKYRYIIDLKNWYQPITRRHRPHCTRTANWHINVLQNEDEHRLLDSVDTKYDTLITHIWALKTTQNEYKWQHYVYKQSDISHFRIGWRECPGCAGWAALMLLMWHHR